MKHLMKYLRAVVWCLPFLLLLPPSASEIGRAHV